MPTLELEAETLPTPSTLEVDGDAVVRKCTWIQLNFGLPGNSRKVQDDEAQVKANAEEEDDPDRRMVKVTKMLLDSPELDAIRSADSDLRAWVYRKCVPYDTGIHWLPLANADEVMDRCTEHEDRRLGLIEIFCDAYPALCSEGLRRLGALAKKTDYPPIEYIRPKFVFSYQLLNFGPPGQLQAVNPKRFQEERAKLRASFADAAVKVREVQLTTFATMVERLKIALTDEGGKKKRLYDTAVEKFKEFLKDFGATDVTNYRELKEYIDRANALLSGVSVETLRDTDSARDRVRKSMEQIGKALEPLVGNIPGRKFRLED